MIRRDVNPTLGLNSDDFFWPGSYYVYRESSYDYWTFAVYYAI